MGKKFLNKSKGAISFGSGLTVELGNIIELDDKVVEEKKAAIENLIKSGELTEGTKDKEVSKAKEEPEAEEKQKPKGKK